MTDTPQQTDKKPESKGGKLSQGKDKRAPGPPWARAEKPRNFTKAIRDLFKYIGKYRYTIYLGVGLSIIGALLSIVGPQFLREMSDLIFEGIESGTMNMDAITTLGLIILAVYSGSLVLRIAAHLLIRAVSERIAYVLRRDLAYKVDQLPLNYYDNSSTGDIMSRLTNDADTIGDSCGHSISMLLTAATMFAGCVAMMFFTNPILAAVSVIPAIVGFIIMRVIISSTHKYYVKWARNLGAMNGHVEEVYYGHDIINAYNGEEQSREKFVKINQDLYESTFKTRFITGTMPQLMGFVGNFSYVIVCVVGSMLVIKGDITYGVIVAFIVYVRMFNQPLLQMSDALASMQSLAASSERVFDLLNAPTLEDESHKKLVVKEVKGAVRFDDVTFSYIEGNEIIHHFTLDVKPGEKIAIVGPTGAGKTTVVNLLMRFYEVDSGDILIDGVSTKDLRREQVHSMFSMVLQDTWLFNGTIRENLRFNN
ncbi:MAG: ABC transporter ATP-binding protein, partial [archaeon]|nr:ABC transporter ATP-binding protein [archaeon]